MDPIALKRTRRGFTLAELMVTLGILSLLSVGLYRFTIDTSRDLFIAAERLDINGDVRSVTQEMSSIVRASNTFLLYKSFNAGDRDDISDRLRDGESGDFVLLVFLEPYPKQDDPEHITRLVGYFRLPDGTGSTATGPVYRFDIRYNVGNYKNTNDFSPEQLISGLSSSGTYKEIIKLCQGMSNGKLFYNLNDRSVMINAELIHGNAARQVTDTYNFTVSPRG